VRKTSAAPGNALGRSCLIYRGDVGPGIDLQISVRDLPLRGGNLFLGERAVRNMAYEFGMVDGEALAEAMAQAERYKAAYEETRAQLEAAESSLRLLGDMFRNQGLIEIVDEASGEAAVLVKAKK
jgi:hypothetical protein